MNDIELAQAQASNFKLDSRPLSLSPLPDAAGYWWADCPQCGEFRESGSKPTGCPLCGSSITLKSKG